MILVGQASRQATRQVTLYLNIRSSLTTQRALDTSTHTRHKPGNRARHIPRAEHLGDTSTHFATQHVIARRGRNLPRARDNDLLDAFGGLLIRVLTSTSPVEGTYGFLTGRGDRSGERAADNGCTLRGIAANRLQERANRSNRFDRQAPLRQRLLLDRHDHDLAQATLARQGRQIFANLLSGPDGHAVEYDRDAQSAAPGLFQVPPSHRIRVTSRSRHKQPQVGAIEQL